MGSRNKPSGCLPFDDFGIVALVTIQYSIMCIEKKLRVVSLEIIHVETKTNTGDVCGFFEFQTANSSKPSQVGIPNMKNSYVCTVGQWHLIRTSAMKEN